jgi:hypothetical protein
MKSPVIKFDRSKKYLAILDENHFQGPTQVSVGYFGFWNIEINIWKGKNKGTRKYKKIYYKSQSVTKKSIS